MSDLTPRSMLDDLLDLEEGLTDWEVRFIDAMDKRSDRGEPFTASQLSRLTEIHNERVINAALATPEERDA